MKKDIHPQLYDTKVICACGNSFQTVSVVKEMKTTLCSGCHPFFTGKDKHVDTAGRIEKYEKKFGKSDY